MIVAVFALSIWKLRTSPPRSTTVAPVGIARWKLVVAAILAIVIAYAIWQFPTVRAQAETGAAYGARIGCSCRYVQGRDIASCATDFEPGMEIVSLEDLPDQRAVRASVPLLASRTARYAGPSGCLLISD